MERISAVNQVHLVPRSDSEDIKLWFQLAEQTFRMSNITNNDEKLTLVLIHLTSRDRRIIGDILSRTELTYEDVKSWLIERLGMTTADKIEHLLEGETIGNRASSEFLRDLRLKCGWLAKEIDIRKYWSDYICAILNTRPDASLD